jgi:hypothetical protein
LFHYNNIYRMCFKTVLYFRPVVGSRKRQQDLTQSSQQAFITQAYVRCEIYNIKITVFCDVTRSSLVDNYQRFGETCYINLQDKGGSSRFFRNVNTNVSVYTVSHGRRPQLQHIT